MFASVIKTPKNIWTKNEMVSRYQVFKTLDLQLGKRKQCLLCPLDGHFPLLPSAFCTKKQKSQTHSGHKTQDIRIGLCLLFSFNLPFVMH